MNNLDTSKLTRLRGELGHNTSLVCELIEEFAAGVLTMQSASSAPAAERSELVHRLAGTASMLASQATLVGLNHLELALRDGDAKAETSYPAMCTHLDEVVTSFRKWATSAPPDGVPD